MSGLEDNRGTPLLPRRPSAFTYARYRLRVLEGPNAGLVCTSDEAELGIGTAEGNHLVLSDPSISRHHCTLEVTTSGYRLRDLRSTNGTYLGPHRIESAYLSSGALIGLGVTRVSFECLGEQVREELGPPLLFGRLIGESVAMGRVLAALPRVAASDATVLIEGETGTGKGLVAEALHQASGRSGGPLITVDCAAISPGVVESELFGHERGAFTGAHATRIGAFELAQGGTVFLDEIGELPAALQPKLLRVLEEREIRRIGGRHTIKLDFRIVAATNRDLRHAVNTGAFRADLYHRLNIVRLHLPPLRDRPEDIPLLLDHFCRELVGAGANLSEELRQSFARQDWPGNVRELRNAVERCLLLDDGGWAGDPAADRPMADPSAAFDPQLSFRAARARSAQQWEQRYLTELMAHVGGNLSAASRLTGIDRTHLRTLLRRHGVV